MSLIFLIVPSVKLVVDSRVHAPSKAAALEPDLMQSFVGGQQ
jgi:hypothetical protein